MNLKTFASIASFILSQNAISQVYNIDQKSELAFISVPLFVSKTQKVTISLKYDKNVSYQGYFGRGWCSPLDWSVRPHKDIGYRVKQCAETFIFIEGKAGASMTSNKNKTLSLQKYNFGGFQLKAAHGEIFNFSETGQLEAIISGGHVLRIDKNSKLSDGILRVEFAFDQRRISGLSTAHGRALFLFKDFNLETVQSDINSQMSKSERQISQFNFEN